MTDDNPAAATLTITAGETIKADLVFKCVGVRPATALYAASLQGAGQLSACGAVAVEPTLQASGGTGAEAEVELNWRVGLLAGWRCSPVVVCLGGRGMRQRQRGRACRPKRALHCAAAAAAAAAVALTCLLFTHT